MNVNSESEVAQPCPTLRDPMDCSLSVSSAHGIFQARVLEWVAIVLHFALEEQYKSLIRICLTGKDWVPQRPTPP